MPGRRAHACSSHEHEHASAARNLAFPSPNPLQQSPAPRTAKVKGAGSGVPSVDPSPPTKPRASLLPGCKLRAAPRSAAGG